MATLAGLDDLITLLKTIRISGNRPIVVMSGTPGDPETLDVGGDVTKGVITINNVTETESNKHGTGTEVYDIVANYYLDAQTDDSTWKTVRENIRSVIRQNNVDDTRTYDIEIDISYSTNQRFITASLLFTMYNRLIDVSS